LPLDRTYVEVPDQLRSATRQSRLMARLIDFPLSFYGLLFAMNLPGLPATVRATMIGVAAIAIPIQLALLTSDGQTLGKKALKVRIVREDTDENGGFMTNVLMRGIVNGVISITGVYAVVDVLFILMQNRRCLHDYLAGTKVVRDPEYSLAQLMGRLRRWYYQIAGPDEE
jgi:uncharacterized RDD family membrane protein YckC